MIATGPLVLSKLWLQVKNILPLFWTTLAWQRRKKLAFLDGRLIRLDFPRMKPLVGDEVTKKKEYKSFVIGKKRLYEPFRYGF